MKADEKVKVLIINSVCGTGSTGNIVAGLYKILKKRSYQCKIICGVGRVSKVPDCDVYKMNNKIGYYIHNALARVTDGAGFFSYRKTKKVIEYIKEFNPDIVHLHNIHGFYINIKVLFDYLKEAGKPVVWTLHDCWAFTGHCAHFDYVGCDKWKYGCKNCAQIDTYPISLIDKSKRNFKIKKKLFTSVGNMLIITPSEWLADLVRESYLNKYFVKVINNGIDLNKFNMCENDFKRKHNIENKKVILGVSSVWNNKKGLNDFFELARKLDSDYKIVIVGQIDGIELPNNILHIPRTESQTELAQIYSAADVFVNMTLEDTFPTVNLEALACGTPVITYKTGGSAEAFDESCGIVTKKRTPDSVVSCLQNAFILKKEDCIKRAASYDMDTQYNTYIDIYENLLEGENFE